jgi:hypothetical protein
VQGAGREARGPYRHPHTNAEAIAQIKALKSMKIRTAAAIQTRHHRPLYATSGIYDTSGYGATATRDRGASMAPEGPSPSLNQLRLLGQLATDAGEPTPVPITAEEARGEINRLRTTPRAARPQGIRRPSPRQLSYLASLTRDAGEAPIVPDTSQQASTHIDRLLTALARKPSPTTTTQPKGGTSWPPAPSPVPPHRPSASASCSPPTPSPRTTASSTASASSATSVFCRAEVSSSLRHRSSARTADVVVAKLFQPGHALTQYDLNDRTVPARGPDDGTAGHERDLEQMPRSYWSSGGVGEIFGDWR